MLSSQQLDSVLNAVLRGRSDDFIEVVRAYGPGLRVFLGTRLFHVADIDDLAQETFITAYRKLNTFRRGEDFGAWLRGIARNKLLQFFEKNRRRSEKMSSFREEAAEVLERGAADGAALVHHEGERLQAMLKCITRLPERIRHVVRAQLDGRKATALAEEMNTSPGAVYQLQYRGLQMLRDCVQKEGMADAL